MATEFLVAIDFAALSVIVGIPVVLRRRGGAGHVVGVGPGDVPRRDLGVSVITGPQPDAGRDGCFVRGQRDEEHPRAGDQKHHDEHGVDPERRGQAGADRQAQLRGLRRREPELAGRDRLADLDGLPVPRFDDYFDALAASPLRDAVRPGIPKL